MSTANPLSAGKHAAQTIRIDILPRFSDSDATGVSVRDTGNLRRTLLNVEDYRFLFENAYDATLLTHEDGRIIVANVRAERLLCCSEKALHEMDIQHIVSGMDETVWTSITAELKAARFLRITAWCARYEGEPFPAEIAVTRLEHEGEVWLCFFIRDETLKRQDEESLRTVHHAMQNAGTGIAVADLNGRLVHTNPALRRMWRIDDAAAPSLTLAGLLGGPIAEAVMTVIQPNAPSTWTHELPVHHDTEDPHWIQVSAAANTDSDNVATGVVLSFVDVSDRFRADAVERLHERDRVMAQSLGAVCHHLGQPTTVLLSSIEMLQLANTKDPEIVQSLLEMSMSAAEEIRLILRKLNELDVYKAVPYLASDTSKSATAIIELDASNG